MKKFDVIVIGSGPGGSISASALKKAGFNVAVLEAGKHYNLSDIKPFTIDEMLNKYWNGGITFSLGKPKISFVMGKCAGGGSEVNSGLYHRIPNEVLDEWIEKYKLANFSNIELEEHYQEIEKKVNISYMPNHLIPRASFKLDEGAKSLGWKCLEVPRWFKYDNEHGIKQSMTETYLKDCIDLEVPIFYEQTVKRIFKSKSNWKINTFNGDLFEAKYVFICAGAVQSASILLRSGIKKNVGKNLQFHPTIKATALFDEEINSKNMGVPVHQVKQFSPLISMGCSISSLPYLSLALADFRGYENFAEKNWKNMAIYYSMIRPEGRARIINIPGSKDPIIKYDLTLNDMENLQQGLKKLTNLLFKSGAKKVFPSISDNKYILNNFDEFDSKIPTLSREKTQLMTIHMFSSCPAGENRKICATNSYGKVYDRDNLYLNDASILCTSLGVNPQGAIMVMAKRNVENFIKEVR